MSETNLESWMHLCPSPQSLFSVTGSTWTKPCARGARLGLSVDSEFPNFMNNFLTIRPIRPWHPVPGTVAESPPRTQFNLAQAEPCGALKGRLGTAAKQAAWSNSAAVFPTLRAQWCQALILWQGDGRLAVFYQRKSSSWLFHHENPR